MKIKPYTDFAILGFVLVFFLVFGWTIVQAVSYSEPEQERMCVSVTGHKRVKCP